MGSEKKLAAMSMLHTHPELVREWHPTKNEDLSPADVVAGTHKAIWWQCTLGHEWQAKGTDRVNGQGCAVCKNKKVLAGFNDLSTTNPELAREWHPTKNDDLLPSQVVAGTNKKVWWRCEFGHEWQAAGADRLGNTGCPICINKQVLVGFNDLATTHPQLSKEWHPTKNGDLLPSQVVAGTNKKVWWRCEFGHEWQVSANNRSGNQTGCPFCSGQKVAFGDNDMSTTNPELAKQWHPTKNGELLPTQFRAGTNKKIWWICELGHEWQSTGASRLKGSGCSVCLNQKVEVGFNDLSTTNPELAREWHPTKNGDLLPSQVVAGTEKLIWWLCEYGHEYQALGKNRKKGAECHFCTNQAVLAGFNDLASTNPTRALEWHPTKNGDLGPNEVTEFTNQKIWWMCHLGHEWFVSGASRGRNSGCPTCGNKTLLVGFNDLATTNPELLSEWHTIRNEPAKPSDMNPGTLKKVWWQCELGHEWQAAIASRTGQKSGCPTCAKYGFDPMRPAIFYFIAHQTLQARKVGITNVGTDRMLHFEKTKWTTIFTQQDSSGHLIRELETAVLQWLRNDLKLSVKLSPKDMGRRGGWSETFDIEGPTDELILDRIKSEYAKLLLAKNGPTASHNYINYSI